MEKVIIVLLNVNNKLSDQEIEYKIEELKELVRASLGQVEYVVTQNASSINPRTYIGPGKAEEIKVLCDNHDIETVIFNHELTGSQTKNLEDIINRKIVDRTGLILDIFARRANTKEAKLQVKLAQLEYRLPRLQGYRNYLSREGAGIGTRGPGEQKLEIDRRSVQNEITSIKHKLKDTKLKRDIKRKRRVNSSIPVVSLVGYSNSGKSTILNNLSDMYSEGEKQVYSDDLLFATLDTSVRNIILKNDREIVVTDTVGFVSNLPIKLIESFKSTLEEIEESDLILIVIDASNPNYQLQLKSTNDVLKEMKIDRKKVLHVFNKMDLNPDFKDFNKHEHEIYISALNNEEISLLIDKIEDLLFESYVYKRVLIPYSDFDKIKYLVPSNLKDQDEYLADGVKTYIYIDSSHSEGYKKYFIEDDNNA